MKICAVTMVYRDYWALSRWYAHHGQELGTSNLVVVAHGEDPQIARLCPGARIITIPRDRLNGFDRERHRYLAELTAELLKDYDWVIRTDADEVLCYDREIFGGLRAALGGQDKQRVPVLWALGFDLIETPQSAPIGPGPVFSSRRDVVFSGHYSKAVAVSQPYGFRLHGAEVAPDELAGFPFHMPRGLYLAHLKFANSTALADANSVRRDVALSGGKGLPGKAWQDPEQEARRVMEGLAEKNLLPWKKAEAKAYGKLATNPARDERFNVVRARRLRPGYRTLLPDRFAVQG